MKTSVSLLERVQTGADDEDWKQLADLYTPLIRGWLHRNGMPSPDVDDAVQEVLTVVMRKLPEFQRQPRPGAFRAWLRNITVICVRDFFRKRNRYPQPAGKSSFQTFLEQMADPDSGLSRMWDEEHDRHVFRVLVERVRPEFAESTWTAFRRTAVDGLPAKDAAKELGISLNAVFIARSRVLSRLKQEAKGLLNDD